MKQDLSSLLSGELVDRFQPRSTGRGSAMFETLQDQMKIDEERATNKRERVIRWTLIVVLSVLLFGALYVGIHMLGGS